MTQDKGQAGKYQVGSAGSWQQGGHGTCTGQSKLRGGICADRHEHGIMDGAHYIILQSDKMSIK